ncbi:MAG: PAS domain-containing protein [Oscillochloris sp.]|nr:PAS domain-containing protein [Oscillochloris sp.]
MPNLRNDGPENEEWMPLALRAGRMGTWDWNIVTGEQVWSSELEQLLGLKTEQRRHTVEAFFALVHPADREGLKARTEETLRTGREYVEDEFRMLKPDGTITWFSSWAHLLRDVHGRVVRITGVNMDITERKRAELALRESEERFRRIADTAPALIWIADTARKCTWFNQPWLHFTGRIMEQELGDGWTEGLHADDRERCIATYVAAFNAREPFSMDYRLRRYDGAYRWLLDKGVPHFAADGSFLGYIGSCIEIEDRKQAEEALRLANERFRLAQDASNGFVYDWDLVKDYVQRSDGLTRVLGYKLDEIAPTGDGWAALVHPADLKPQPVESAATMPSEGTTRNEYRVRHKNGEWIWMLDRSITFYRDGKLRRMIGSTVDISDHKRAEAALRESQYFLERLTGTIPSVIYVFDLTANRNIYTNRQIWEMLGYTSDEVTAMGDNFLPSLIHPADWAETPVFVARLLELADGQFQEREYRICHKNGTYRWWYSREMVFNRDAQGRPTQILGSALDITERKATEAALLEAQTRRLEEERHYAVRLQQLNQASVVIHAAASQEAVLHLVAEEARKLVGVSEVEADIPGSYALERGIARHNDQGADRCLAIPLIGRDGNMLGLLRLREPPDKPFSIADEALLQQLAQIAAVALENQLLYAQEQAARAQAEESNRLKDEFLATVSHELRTPLTAFMGYAQLLLTRKRDEAYITRTLEKMVRSAKTQAQLIEDLLDISRIVSGKLRITPQLIDAAYAIHAAIDTIRPSVEAKRQRLHVDVKTGIGTVIGDNNRLQQIAWNLFSNATKFTPPGGAIYVSLRAQDSSLQLSVRDTGQGIKPGFLPYVFEPFRQAESTSLRSQNGLGLGLAIVRHLVELHGGTISVASEGEHQGARFTLQLPLAANDKRPVPFDTPIVDLPESYPAELRNLRVLLVDDQRDILELLHEILTPCGVITYLCSAAHEALAALNTWQPQVLICDIAMPYHDGYWLIEQVRARKPEAGGNLPAIALTAYVRMDDRVQLLAAGFQQYVPKPVEPAVLRSVIAHLVRSEKAHV